MTGAPYREVRLGPSDVVVDRRPDGSILVRSPHSLGTYPARMTEPLDYWARHASYRTFLAQREPKWGWRNVTYAETQFFARRIGQALVNRGLSVEHPVIILSGNEIEHALLGIGCMYAGVPYAPISTAYSLVSTDFSQLRYIFDLLTPGLVYVSDGALYERAIRAVLPSYAELVVNINAIPGATPFADLVNAEPNDSLDQAYAQVHADTVFKILFTSGSTGIPKGVINTHRMWASNQEMALSYFAFLADEPPVIVDWLPWNHTFGGNADVGLVLYNGGSLYIDRGRPAPGLFDETIHTLRMIAPTMYWNVPKAFEALIPHLRDDPSLRKRFFSRLKLLYYAGAGLSQQVWEDLAEIALQECGERILLLTGLGSTETAPHALFGLKESDRPGLVGVPAPGVELKLVPNNSGKFEARLRGPNITPGYWRRLDLTRAAFDEEGFYKLGDCLRFADESDPGKGFVFDGRIAEDFKLSSGTWVSVGPLRARFVAHCAPYVQDVVIAGHDRDYIGALIFPTAEGRGVVDPPAVFKNLLETFAASSTGNSNRIAAAIILEQPPSIDAQEITDKGSINQRAVLENRRDQVEELYRQSTRTIRLSGDILRA
jgi:feruloyl-CoA synthase